MTSEEYKRISKAIVVALGPSKRYNRTAENIKKQKESGALDYKFKKFVKPDFKILLKGFINILEDPSLKNKPNYRRILLYTENDFLKLFESYSFELGSWLTKETDLTPDNNRSFFNFPLFFKESCRKCNINKYAIMSEEELDILLSNSIDLKHTQSIVPRKDRNIIEKEIKVVTHTMSPSMNMYNTLAEEYSYNGLINSNDKVIRVSRDCGSGYGFDLLSVNDDREDIITIKACDNMESFLLSKTEYNAMIKACNESNTNYYIHKYLFVKDEKTYRLFNIYEYDKSNNVLVDVKDDSNICNIERKEFYGKNGILKTRYVCTPVNFKYVKEDHSLKKVLKK